MSDASAIALAGRTARAARALGHAAEVVAPASLPIALAAAPGAAWILSAGAVPRASPRLDPSATGRPLIALGVARTFSGAALPEWGSVYDACGGLVEAETALPPPVSVYVERPGDLARALEGRAPLSEAVRSLATAHRVVLVGDLDVAVSERLRAALVVTSLHRGGAERVVLDLLGALPRAGVDARLAVLDRPRREAFAPPPETLLLYERARTRSARLALLARAAVAWGADVVHAHLLDGADVEGLSERGPPVVVTAHNARAGWPPGYATLGEAAAALVIACSLATARELRASEARPPVRTAWNGIQAVPAAPEGTRVHVRREIGVPADALVVVTVANARPQKRLERVPGAIAELLRRGVDAHWVVVGGLAGNDGAARAALEALDSAVAHAGVAARVHRVGPRVDVSRWLAAADVFLSTSDFEGLSLAHVEARAAGLPLVATRTGGSDELSRMYDACTFLERDASPDVIAAAVLAAGPASPALPHALGVPSMAARHGALYARAARPRAGGGGRGVVLVTNNFSTGGAQTSARRLLVALARRGVPCRAVVIEERPERRTPGLVALESSGVPVALARRAGAHDPKVTADDVVRLVDEHDPRAVVFWNVIPEHKVLIADALLGRRVFDVSPGEMYFRSLERYFAKPRVGLPYLDGRDYGALLAGVVVKYAAEAERARSVLGAPVEVVANGVVIPPAVAPRAAGPRAIGTLARIGPDKKLEDLVDAFRLAAPALGGCELVIGGDPEGGSGTYAADLRARAEGLPVRWLGHVAPEELFSVVDLFALVAEPAGCPNASLEAMAHGRPVLATDVGGMSEQVAHGETGWLVPRGDVAELARGLARAFADPDLLPEVGARGRARAIERFSVERMVVDYARVFDL